jgi:hypothetical protein
LLRYVKRKLLEPPIGNGKKASQVLSAVSQSGYPDEYFQFCRAIATTWSDNILRPLNRLYVTVAFSSLTLAGHSASNHAVTGVTAGAH